LVFSSCFLALCLFDRVLKRSVGVFCFGGIIDWANVLHLFLVWLNLVQKSVDGTIFFSPQAITCAKGA
jgi:hypothetical protein